MPSIGGITNGNSHLQATGETLTEAASSPLEVSPLAEHSQTAQSVKVSLSGVGLQKSAASSADDRDIEESGLPENIQNILKMIRKLKQQIAEKLAELQAVMANRRLSPEESRAKVAALQSAMAGLNAGLMTANTALAKALKEAELSPELLMKAASLAMKS
jgi:hypothetical protein